MMTTDTIKYKINCNNLAQIAESGKFYFLKLYSDKHIKADYGFQPFLHAIHFELCEETFYLVLEETNNIK